MLLRIALLGAVKHYKRSLVVAGAVAVACAVMIAIGSLLVGITASFYDSVVPVSGHVRVDSAERPKALDPLGLAALVGDADALRERIMSLGDPRIVEVEPLLSFGALLVEDRGEGDPRNIAMRGMGVRPGTRFADNARDGMKEGDFLPGGSGIALSKAAARLVGAAIGDSVLVLVRDRSGQPWYESLRVTGLFETESVDFDETTFYVDEAKAAEMLDVPGSCRELRLLLSGRDEAPAVAAEVAALAGPGLRVEDWETINASTFALLLFVKILLGAIMGLFAIVAASIIANVSLMSVMERLREYGTMRALGLRGREVERLILVEGASLGLAGAALGMALGSAVVWLLSRGGVDLGGIMESVGLRRYNKPRPDALWYSLCALASLAVGVLATARAARSVRARSVAESLASPS